MADLALFTKPISPGGRGRTQRLAAAVGAPSERQRISPPTNRATAGVASPSRSPPPTKRGVHVPVQVPVDAIDEDEELRQSPRKKEQMLLATAKTLSLELHECDHPHQDADAMAMELRRLHGEERRLLGVIDQERETVRGLRRYVESLHLGDKEKLKRDKVETRKQKRPDFHYTMPTRTALAREEKGYAAREETLRIREEARHIEQGLRTHRGGKHSEPQATPRNGGSRTARSRAERTPSATSHTHPMTPAGRPAAGAPWPSTALATRSARDPMEGDIDALLEQVIEHGDPTLTAATAKLAQTKLAAAEAAAAQFKEKERELVERMKAEMYGSVEQQMAARMARQDGQSGRLGEAIPGHHGLIRLHPKA
mgnify:CR=1 FL=1